VIYPYIVLHSLRNPNGVGSPFCEFAEMQYIPVR